MEKLKDWDISGRNLNLPSWSGNFLSASENVNSPSRNGYHSKEINHSPAIKKDDFLSATENTDFLPTIENDYNRHTFKNKGQQFASKMLNIPLVSKPKICRKLKKEVPNKKPKLSKSKRPITPLMQKFISSATDKNILKSRRTYAKKKESISPVHKDTLNNVARSTAISSSEMTNTDRFCTVKRNQSSPLKHTNGYVDSEDNINHVTSKLSTDSKHYLFDDVFSECNGNGFECSNELESADFIRKENLTSECSNGYQRTRKNLKIHLGGKRKAGSKIDPAPTVKKSNSVKPSSKVASKKILDTHSTIKKPNLRKGKVNTKAPIVHNETGLPILLQDNDSLKKVEMENCKHFAYVSPIVRKPRVSESTASDTSSTHVQTSSSERSRKKITPSSLGSLRTQNCSKEHNKKGSEGIVKYSVPRKRMSILDIVQEPLFNQCNELKVAPRSQFKDCAPKSDNNSLEINDLNCPAPKTKSSNYPLNKSTNSNLVLNSMEDHSSSSINVEKFHHLHIVNSLILEKQDLYTSLQEIAGYMPEDKFEGANATNCASLLQRQQPVGRKKRSISFDGGLRTVEHPQLSNCLSSESDSSMDIEATKNYIHVKQSKTISNLSAQKHSENGGTENNLQNSELLNGTSGLNFSQQNTSSPSKLNNPHICSKFKLLNVPLLVCDCNNPNSTSSNADLLSLSEEINNFTSKLLCIAKNNPQELQSKMYDSALDTFRKKVKKYFLENDTENSVSSDSHLLKTFSPTYETEYCTSLGASCSMEPNLQMQSTALECNLEAKHDIENHSEDLDFNTKDPEYKTTQTEASYFSCDLDSEACIQNQNKSFMQNAFDQINFIYNHCITQLMFDYIGNCDAFELQASVQHFCDDPQTIEGLSKCLTEIEEFTAHSFTAKLQYEFPVNFQDLPLFTVIKDYIKYFIFKIFPLNRETITSQFVLDFAYENMSASEVSAVSCFFNEVKLLKPTDFISRFTYVAIVSIYREYQKRKESITS